MRSLVSLASRLGCPKPEKYMFNTAIIDSRMANPGTLFFALHGDNTDGHKFVRNVLGAGGSAVVSRDGFIGPILEVDSVEEALLEAGAWARDCIKVPVVGVTGSSGKTTVRLMLAAALATRFDVSQTKGNLNNHLGLPLSLLNVSETAEMVLLEMGMNHSGELYRLGWAARPNVSLVTNIGTAHIEFLGSRENIAKAKAELLQTTETGGTAVIPFGEKILLDAAIKQGLEVITHGIGGDCFVKDGIALPWGIDLKLNYTGEHSKSNAVIAIAAAEKLGIDPFEAYNGIAKLVPTAGRGETILWNSSVVVDESYNANPESTTACLKSVAESYEKPLFAVLGDMLELGMEADYNHREIVKLIDRLNYEHVIFVGDLYQNVLRNNELAKYTVATDWFSALEILRNVVEPNSAILIKGSNSIKLSNIVNQIKKEGF